MTVLSQKSNFKSLFNPTKYGITMDIQEDKTVSVKGDRKNVKLVEDEIIKILEEQSFEAMISEYFVGPNSGQERKQDQGDPRNKRSSC